MLSGPLRLDLLGLLGRKRVTLLYESNVELPSDLNGLVYVPLDPAGG
ncbi:TIR domain-containing protein [Frigoribacterium sp. VKM Ac-2836]|nr:nucleotide-binding protein [Frigoribacterium sp. VKM Ac-2836]